MQIFDRKSVNIDPKTLAIAIVAFANADGGTVAIGISDKTRRIEGIDYEIQKLIVKTTVWRKKYYSRELKKYIE